MSVENMSVLELIEMLKSHKITSVELTKYYLSQIEKYKDKNAVLEVFEDALIRAEEMDKVIAVGGELPKLAGIPVLIKDNFQYTGHICSCGSKMLENYKSQYNATAVQKLLDEGAVIIGRTNMDEFAMGGSTENSAFGPCKNAHDDTRVSGGSSGGSAVAVALDMCAFALGSDTGGSVRQPASFNGIVGLKPTYARISRFGLVAFASSLDCVGLFTKTAKDNAYILSILAGFDIHDETSSRETVDDYMSSITGNISGKKIAVIKEVQALVEKTGYTDVYNKVLENCQKAGAIVTEVSIPDYDVVLPTYYIICKAEASSNLGRYDGVKYTSRSENISDIDSVYSNTRSEFFGKEVKRRIMVGNFVLSSEHYNAYYVKAKQIAQKLKYKFLEIFKDNDLIFMPTTYGEAFEIGSKTSDPVSMYIEDIFTVTANMVSVPAMSIPVGTGKAGLPLGMQIVAKHFNEKEIFNMADYIMRGEK